MKSEFSDDQFESAYPDGIENHWWFLARNKVIADSVFTFAGATSTVLEIGCGRGIAVKSLRDIGINCSGVELANIKPLCTVEKYIHIGIDAVELPYTERQRYDTILLLDVIEHIPDPVVFLQKLSSAFPNLSRIIITVPARQELWSNYDEFYGHFRRYTLEMLETLSNKLCWRLNRNNYFFHLVYLPAWIITKRNIKRQTLIKPPQGPNKFIHKLIFWTMIADYYVFPRRIPGTSIICCLHPCKIAHSK